MSKGKGGSKNKKKERERYHRTSTITSEFMLGD